MLDEIKEFWTALSGIPYATTVVGVLVTVIILITLYSIFIKKNAKLRAAVVRIVTEMIMDAREKGVTVEFVVNDILDKAEKKILAKPDCYDKLLLMIVRSKWVKNKLIFMTMNIIENVVAEDKAHELEKTKEQLNNYKRELD